MPVVSRLSVLAAQVTLSCSKSTPAKVNREP